MNPRDSLEVEGLSKRLLLFRTNATLLCTMDNDALSRLAAVETRLWPEQPERLPSSYLGSFEHLSMEFNHVYDHLGPAAPSSTHTQSCILGFTPSQTCLSAAFTSCDVHTGPTLGDSSAGEPSAHAQFFTRYSSAPNVSSLHHPGTSQSHLLYRHIPASQPTISHFSCCCRAVESDIQQQPEIAVERSNPTGGGVDHVSSLGRGRPSFSSSLSHSKKPSQGGPTNFVSLSRKSSYKRLSFFFWKKKASSSSITGPFLIDPLLRLPTGLLKVIDSGLSTPTSRTPVHQIRKNLLLEVENGSINVDIHLVPSKIQILTRREAPHISPTTVHPEFRQQPEQRRPTDKRYLHPDSARMPVNQQQAMRSSCSNLGIIQDSDSHAPTRIDLLLKAGRSSSGRKYGLIARIDAPNPRPPFHVLASTIDNASQPKIPPVSTSNTPRRIKLRRHISTKAKSRSPITLHLPRTFHGPLTIQVISGNIDANVRLSKELSKVAVILSERALSRGYFISPTGLAEFGHGVFFQEEVESDPEGWVIIEECHAPRTSGRSDEWYGDKVDVIAGDGKVYLQFVDEQDPFKRKKRFWPSLGIGCR